MGMGCESMATLSKTWPCVQSHGHTFQGVGTHCKGMAMLSKAWECLTYKVWEWVTKAWPHVQRHENAL